MKMKVLGTSQFGRKHLSFFTDHPEPCPCPESPTDVVIKVEYSDINPVDHHKLNAKPDGTPTPEHRTPLIVGYGGSGVVESVSSSADERTRALLRKRVAFIADPAKDGSYASRVLCDRRVVATIPDDGIPSHLAACVPIAGCTALESLEKVGLPIASADNDAVDIAKAGEGKRLLVVGGAGGVGSWIVRLARSNYPMLEVVCTAGSEGSAEWCRKMGCSRTVGHDEVRTLGGGPRGSCDHVICLAEPNVDLFSSVAEVLRPFGKICLVVAGEGIKTLDLSFVFFKSGSVVTQTVFSSIRGGYCLDQAGEMTTILELMKKGRVIAPISDAWEDGKSDWKESSKKDGYIDMVAGGHTKGKLVMKIGE